MSAFGALVVVVVRIGGIYYQIVIAHILHGLNGCIELNKLHGHLATFFKHFVNKWFHK